MNTELELIAEAYIGMISEVDSGLEDLISKTKEAHPEIKNLDISPYHKDIKLDNITIHKEHRGTGVGSAVMNKIKDYADTNKKRILLTANSKDPSFGTTSFSRLDKFYKSHGFTPNKGRNKDYSVSATHIYEPK